MSNEEIVMLVQAGDSSKLLELWKGVERFVWQQANRRYLLTGGLGGVEIEDLRQSGFRSKKRFRDPLHHSASLDVPATEDSDTTIAELIEDPDAAQAFQDAERRIYLEQLRTAIEDALAQLPPDQRAAVIGRFWKGETVDGKTINAALRTLRHPRISRALQAAM